MNTNKKTFEEELAELPKWANWALLQAWFTKQSQGNPFPDSKRSELGELIVNRFAETIEETYPVGAKPSPRTFLVIATGGYWGKGKTLAEATKNSKAGFREKALIYLVLNASEESVWVDGYGKAHSDAPGAVFMEIGKSTVGGINQANKE